MYDIEVIDGKSYAVITEDSPAYNFLKAFHTKLIMKKLSAETPDDLYLTRGEVSQLCKGFKVEELKRLIAIDLLGYKSFWRGESDGAFRIEGYFSTEYGMEIAKDIKDFGGDIEIRI